ncbi:MAG: RidA family protein [Bacillota bacterium]
MSPEEKLENLGYSIPEVPAPLAAYVPGVVTGNYLYTSGQLPTVAGELEHVGRLGAELTLEEGYGAARLSCLNCLGVIKSHLGDLSRVRRIVKVTGYVASTADFTDHPAVVNGTSELLGEVFGDKGAHARAAVGVAALPKGAPVEIEMIVEFE